MNRRLAIAVEEFSGNIYKVAENFGKCSKFIICEINSRKQVVIKETYFNPLNGHHNEQYQLPGYIKQFEVNTIIAGGMGREAVLNFHKYGIDVFIAPGLQYEEALNLFLQDKLSGCEENAGHDHNN